MQRSDSQPARHTLRELLSSTLVSSLPPPPIPIVVIESTESVIEGFQVSFAPRSGVRMVIRPVLHDVLGKAVAV